MGKAYTTIGKVAAYESCIVFSRRHVTGKVLPISKCPESLFPAAKNPFPDSAALGEASADINRITRAILGFSV